MSATAAAMRLEVNRDRNMIEQVERLNTGIYSVSDSDRFVTLLVAQIDARVQPFHLLDHVSIAITSSRMAAAVADIRRAAGTPFPATSATTIWVICASMGNNRSNPRYARAGCIIPAISTPGMAGLPAGRKQTLDPPRPSSTSFKRSSRCC